MTEPTLQKPMTRREAIRSALIFGLFGGSAISVISLDSGLDKQQLSGDFIQKKPTPPPVQKIQSTVSNDNRVLDIIANDDNATSDKNWTIAGRFANNHPTYPDKYGILFDPDGAIKAFKFFLLDPWDGGPTSQVSTPFVGTVASIDFPGSIAVAIGGGLDDGFGSDSWDWNRFRNLYSGPGFGEMRNTRLSTQVYDAFNIDTVGRSLFIDTTNINGRSDRLAWREATTPTNLRDALAADELDKTTVGLITIGPPTAAAGTTNRIADQGHRHSFSGRWIPTSCYFPTAVNAGLPFLKLRIKSNNNWTLRRVFATAGIAPIGGNETFGIVNAAGVLQGTAVTITPGIPDAETALQVTNLTGGTLYYFAQTASTSVTQATDIMVGIEYTMNI